MRLKIVILALFIVSCLGCSTTKVVIKNFDESEYYEVEKDGEVFHCMSDYYVQQIINVKIDKVNPK